MFILLVLLLNFMNAQSAVDQCQTRYDELNIPHIKTSSQKEFYFCFGLRHGEDRAWEMDHFRRTGQGRNAEILGFSHLKSDLMMRLLDLPSLANKIWNNYSSDQKKILLNYSRGVNEGFKQGKKALEFKDLDYSPEEWRPADTILVLLLQSFDQTRKTFTMDYDEEKFKNAWGKDATELFDEDGMPWENTVLKEGEYQKKNTSVKTSLPLRKFALWSAFPEVFGNESGSNNWVIDKSKSKTGKAILANDPHLDLKTPLFWYWINIKSPKVAMVGASLPGVPIVASGTNGRVSWGLTNSYLNSADLFFIKDIADKDFETIRPTVMVKWWFLKLPFFFKSFQRLKSGHPVLPFEIERKDKIVLRWSGFSLRPDDIYPMFALHKVKNVSEMDALMAQIGVPAWNFVFADTDGNIGYRMVGKTYRHEEKTSMGIRSLKKEEFNKEKFLSSTESPHLLKPTTRHSIHTANNRHWPRDAKFYGGRAYSYSFRGFRIEELLEGKQNVASSMKIQCDTQVVDARFFLPKLKQYLKLSTFENWSMSASDSSKELPLYRRLMDILIDKWNVNEYALYRILDKLSAEKISELRRFYEVAKSEVKNRSWGDIHRLKFSHMSKKDDWNFSPDISGVGDTHSVNPGTAKWNSELSIYEQYSGASMRMIIEMSSPPQIWLSLPGLNREYTKSSSSSPWKDWRACQYREVKF